MIQLGNSFARSILLIQFSIQFAPLLLIHADLLCDFRQFTVIASLFILLDLFCQRFHGTVKRPGIIGLTDQCIQACMETSGCTFDFKSVLPNENTALKSIGIQSKKGFAQLFRVYTCCGSGFNINDACSVSARCFTKSPEHTILFVSGFKIQGTTVHAALPGQIALALVFGNIMAAFCTESVKHSFQECCQSRFAPTIVLTKNI